MKFYISIFFIAFSISLGAQTASDAEIYFNNKQYDKAKKIYENLLTRKPADALLNYKAARCAYELKQYFEAASYFEKAGTKYPLTDFYLTEIYFLTYQFEKAIVSAERFILQEDADKNKLKQIELYSKKSAIGARLANRIEDIFITDSLILNKSEFLIAYAINADAGKLNQQRIKISGKNIQDKITYTSQRNDRMCFSDSTKGNMDLFSSYKLLENWTAPVSFSATLNTRSNENYPFILPDGITLYYASDGENSMGGYDIFVSKYASASKDFLAPENIGFPFNSTANDYMLVIDENQKTGWFATDRNQNQGKVMVYSFQINDPKKYFKSNDSIKIYEVATLKSYRKSNTATSPKTTKTVLTQQQFARDLIYINDSTVYTNTSQFTSKDAAELYEMHLKNYADYTTATLEINNLRQKYDESEPEEKILYAQKIIQAEENLITLNKQIANSYKSAINAENKNLFLNR